MVLQTICFDRLLKRAKMSQVRLELTPPRLKVWCATNCATDSKCIDWIYYGRILTYYLAMQRRHSFFCCVQQNSIIINSIDKNRRSATWANFLFYINNLELPHLIQLQLNAVLTINGKESIGFEPTTFYLNQLLMQIGTAGLEPAHHSAKSCCLTNLAMFQ